MLKRLTTVTFIRIRNLRFLNTILFLFDTSIWIQIWIQIKINRTLCTVFSKLIKDITTSREPHTFTRFQIIPWNTIITFISVISVNIKTELAHLLTELDIDFVDTIQADVILFNAINASMDQKRVCYRAILGFEPTEINIIGICV